MITQIKEISKTKIMQEIYSRENEETVSFENAYKNWKIFINKLWKNV